MADSTLDFDGDDDAPQREMMIRAATVAGWTVGRLWGDDDQIHAGTDTRGRRLIASEFESREMPLFGESISVGEYDASNEYDGDGEWCGYSVDAVEGAHAWTLIVGHTPERHLRYTLNAPTPAPAAVVALLNALNEIASK